MFSVFGCRIAIDMPDCPKLDLLRNLPLDYELEDITFRKRVGDLESATHSIHESIREDRFSAVSNLDCIKPVDAGKAEIDISPLSHAATLVPVHPVEIVDGRGGEVKPTVPPASRFHASEVTLSSNEAILSPHQTTRTPAQSRRSTLVGGTGRPDGPSFQASVAREARGLSPNGSRSPKPAAKAGPSNRSQEEEDDYYEELDKKLAAEFDDEGRRRPPQRTHQRQWRSQDYLGIPPMLSGQGFLMPRASSSLANRPASAIYYSRSPRFSSLSSASTQPRPTIFPPDTPPPSGATSPSRRRSAERSTSPRMRMSLLWQRYRNDVASVVPEGEVPSSFAPSTSEAQDPPVQAPSRRQSTSSSKSRRGGRVRRLLSRPSSPTSASSHAPPSPSSPSPISSVRKNSGRLARRDSDAITICTVSTDFAFDNSGTFEAPDFN
ncbi:hypothetical protein FRB90_011061 [Tulasnella sp. 427]|nr:hypothetical protein FRB90_011061 [Tulasnella sp. 427]